MWFTGISKAFLLWLINDRVSAFTAQCVERIFYYSNGNCGGVELTNLFARAQKIHITTYQGNAFQTIATIGRMYKRLVGQSKWDRTEANPELVSRFGGIRTISTNRQTGKVCMNCVPNPDIPNLDIKLSSAPTGDLDRYGDQVVYPDEERSDLTVPRARGCTIPGNNKPEPRVGTSAWYVEDGEVDRYFSGICTRRGVICPGRWFVGRMA
ncbi:hypothetical protein BDV98DRAFT_616958 [Pterulicium gracile]|uniref:Uncharacterized protein n=1 Tax=Pterulicium gracile TaxID=1884261 RepID=A0A5C3R243_9AGAR|nr:hypothetical protein BDV98DRAFT_616958 [Pterula gracilis]